jgi:hypothetical protein
MGTIISSIFERRSLHWHSPEDCNLRQIVFNEELAILLILDRHIGNVVNVREALVFGGGNIRFFVQCQHAVTVP